MSSVTGVEIGPGYCVLVRARQHAGALEVTAARVFESAEWPDDSAWQVQVLRGARRELGLPRRATLVAWDAARSAPDAAPEALLQSAGFSVDNVLRPVDALALLGWSDARFTNHGAVAWLSINHHGAAISVLRDTDVLYAHEFSWRIQASEQRVQANLLRRYLYVAQLKPELRRAVHQVRDQSGLQIETAVTCGNVPDLRSLTMPLIRDVDIEFETLDSMEGLRATGPADAVVSQFAPAIRLAGAAAAFGEAHPARRTAKWIGTAAGLVLAAGAAWWAFTVWAAQRPPDVARRDRPSSVSVRSAEPAAAVGTSQAPPEKPEEPAPAPTAATPSRPQSATSLIGGESREGVSGVESEDPLPVVDGVLISSDRRLAVIEGAVVGVGDRIGSRTVAQIELDAVVLREASGREVRLTVRTKPGGS